MSQNSLETLMQSSWWNSLEFFRGLAITINTPSPPHLQPTQVVYKAFKQYKALPHKHSSNILFNFFNFKSLSSSYLDTFSRLSQCNLQPLSLVPHGFTKSISEPVTLGSHSITLRNEIVYFFYLDKPRCSPLYS